MILPLIAMGMGSLTLPQQSVAQMVVSSAIAQGVPPALALGVAAHESGFDPNATHLNTNGTTDFGVMQLNSTTVQTLGVANPLDPQENIDAGVGLLAKYLQQYGGNEQDALLAYASGPGAVTSGTINSTAAGFISSVTSYVPDPSLDLSNSGLDLATGSTPDSSDLGTVFGSFTDSTVSIAGFDIPTTSVLIGGSILLVMAWSMTRRG